MSNFSNYRPGLGQTGAYLVAGKPYMTGSTIATGATETVSFPSVARSVTVTATQNDIRVHFANTGDWSSGKHFVTLTAGGTVDRMTFDVKCKEVFITDPAGGSSFELFAELTGIESSEMFVLTGSGLTD